MPDPAREALRALIQQEGLLFGDFILASGLHATYYFDLRRVSLSSQGAGLIGTLLFARCRLLGAHAIGGPATAAIPLIAATLATAAREGVDLRGAYVRSEAKAHGTGQRLEGPLRPGDRLLLVEDTVTSGGSLLDAAREIQAAGVTIAGATWLVDRGAGGREKLEAAGIACDPLFTLDDFALAPVE